MDFSLHRPVVESAYLMSSNNVVDDRNVHCLCTCEISICIIIVTTCWATHSYSISD